MARNPAALLDDDMRTVFGNRMVELDALLEELRAAWLGRWTTGTLRFITVGLVGGFYKNSVERMRIKWSEAEKKYAVLRSMKEDEAAMRVLDPDLIRKFSELTAKKEWLDERWWLPDQYSS